MILPESRRFFSKPLAEIAPPVLLGVVTGVFILAFAPYLNGREHGMGGDYSLFLTRMFSDYEWFGVNGILSAPWFTPAFCGGIPEWGNPESMPYSLPQWLLFFVDPVWTLQITLAVYALLGAGGMWLLLRRGFALEPWAAFLGSAVFLFNGFFICRIIVGHVNFCVFMLFPWVSYFLARPDANWSDRVLNVLVPGGIIALMIHAGAIAIMPPLGPAWLGVAALQWLALNGRPAPVSVGAFLGRLAVAFLIAGLLALNKLSAMAAFTALFPRDFYSLPGFRNVGGWLSAVLPSLFWRPQPDVSEDIVNLLKVPGLQENDYSVSPLPLLLIVFGLVVKRTSVLDAVRRSSAIAAVLVLMLLLPLVLNLHEEHWTAFLKKLPVLRSSSSLYRWLILYIPFLAIGSALAMHQLPRSAMVAVIAVVLAIAFALTAPRDIYNGFPYNGRPLIAAWRDVHATGHVRPITRMHAPLGPDGMPQREFGAETAIVIGENLVRCFEPLFGYAQEALPWKPLFDGPALEARNGLLNVKNPACFIYPSENECVPGTQFAVTQKEEAGAFLSWESFPFHRSARQRAADAITAIAVPLAFLALMMALGARARRLAR